MDNFKRRVPGLFPKPRRHPPPSGVNPAPKRPVLFLFDNPFDYRGEKSVIYELIMIHIPENKTNRGQPFF